MLNDAPFLLNELEDKEKIMLGGGLLQAIVNGLLSGFPYTLIAIGLSLIWGVMNIVNFAHGDFLMVAMYIAFWMFVFFGMSPLLSLPVCFIALFVLGWFTYKYIVSKVLKGPLLAQVVVTFGISVFLEGLALFLFTGNYRVIKAPWVKGDFNLQGIFISFPKLLTSIISIIVTIIIYWFLKRTKTGKAIIATMIDREAAQLMAINTERINSLAFGIGLGCVGIAGALLSTYYYISPYVGVLFGLISFVIVALGGFGSIGGALIAGIIVAQAESVGGLLVGPPFKYALVFLIYLIVILIKPKGLFGW